MVRVALHKYYNGIAYLEIFSALEDGASLGALLGKVQTKSQIPIATSLYEKIRKERIVKIREETFKQQEEFHLADGAQQESRDTLLAGSFDAQDEGNFWRVAILSS